MREIKEIFANDWIQFRGRAIRPLSIMWWAYRTIQTLFYGSLLAMGYLTIYMISVLM